MAIIRATSPIDLRVSQRYPTRIDGMASVAGTLYPIVIADISVEGALVRGLPLLPPGTKVILEARALNVLATVVRSTANGLGLRFQIAINPLVIVRQNYAGLEHLRRPCTELSMGTRASEPEMDRTAVQRP